MQKTSRIIRWSAAIMTLLLVPSPVALADALPSVPEMGAETHGTTRGSEACTTDEGRTPQPNAKKTHLPPSEESLVKRLTIDLVGAAVGIPVFAIVWKLTERQMEAEERRDEDARKGNDGTDERCDSSQRPSNE